MGGPPPALLRGGRPGSQLLLDFGDAGAGLVEALAGPYQGGDGDAFVAKLSPTGAVLWARQFGTARYEEINDVAPLADGSVYAGVLQPGDPEPSSWLVRLSATGAPLWRQGFIGNLRAIAVDAADNALIGTSSALLARYSPEGALLWPTQVPGGIEIPERGVVVDHLGNFYAIGKLGSDAFVAKYGPDDTLAWLRPIATPADDSAYGLAVDRLGNVYVGGNTDGSLAGANQGGTDVWVMKLDSGGTPLWQRQIGTGEYDDLWDLTVDAVGDVYLTGGTEGALAGWNRGGSDAWVAKLANVSGDVFWAKQFGTPEVDYGTAVAVSGTTLYLVGDTYGSLAGPNLGQGDTFIAKLSTE